MGIDEEFDRFVKASFVGLCRTGYLICGDRQRAEDAAQEALLRAHRHWRRVSDPLAYTRRALSTILIDQSRRPWRREVPTEASPERPLADASLAVDDRDRQPERGGHRRVQRHGVDADLHHPDRAELSACRSLATWG